MMNIRMMSLKIINSAFLKKPSTPLLNIKNRRFSIDFYETYLSPEFPPIGLAQKFLENVHDYTLLPWWATITICTMSIRSLVTIPLSIYSQVILARLESQQPLMKQKAIRLAKEVKVATEQYGWSEKQAAMQFKVNFKRIVKEMYIKENCHPFKAVLVGIFQIPIWISMSLALRNMTGCLQVGSQRLQALRPDMDNGGALWFNNLLESDSTWILPITLGITHFILLKIFPINPNTKMAKLLKYGLTTFAILIVPISSKMPAAITFYWLISALFGLFQNLLLRTNFVKKFIMLIK